MRGKVVITGGNGTLARALGREFSKGSWEVDAPSREVLDVTDRESVRSFFLDRHVDLLVCAAGIVRDAGLWRLTDTDWDKVHATNLTGPAICAQAVLPGMLARRRGHIVLIASHSALHPPAGQAAYAASKAGLLGLGRSLAKEVGGAGIRINTVLPGFMETAMSAQVPSQKIEDFRSDHVLERFNTPERVARFVRFLEEEMPYTSGQTFQLDSRVA